LHLLVDEKIQRETVFDMGIVNDDNEKDIMPDFERKKN
jgi:hypothetical protein